MRALDVLADWPVPHASGCVLVADRPGRPGAGAPLPGAGPAATCGELPPSPPEVGACRGDPDRRFPWASLTKLGTALAVLVSAEEGTVELDGALGPPGSTVRHLLAHASGLGPDGAVLGPPGRRRVYSNAGYELLAGHLADRSGMTFGRYLAEAVLRPLGMADTWLEPGASAAAGAWGSARDLCALGSEVMVPSLIHRSTLEEATSVAFPDLAGVLPGFGRQDPCDWGLGFEIRGTKSPHWTGPLCSAATYGHFGQAGGFVWVDPEAAVACAVLTDRPFGPWARELWPSLADSVLREAGGRGGEGSRDATDGPGTTTVPGPAGGR